MEAARDRLKDYRKALTFHSPHHMFPRRLAASIQSIPKALPAAKASLSPNCRIIGVNSLMVNQCSARRLSRTLQHAHGSFHLPCVAKTGVLPKVAVSINSGLTIAKNIMKSVYYLNITIGSADVVAKLKCPMLQRWLPSSQSKSPTATRKPSRSLTSISSAMPRTV